MFVDCCLPCSPIVTTERRGGRNERRMRPLHKVILEVVFAAIKPTFFKKNICDYSFPIFKRKKVTSEDIHISCVFLFSFGTYWCVLP